MILRCLFLFFLLFFISKGFSQSIICIDDRSGSLVTDVLFFSSDGHLIDFTTSEDVLIDSMYADHIGYRNQWVYHPFPDTLYLRSGVLLDVIDVQATRIAPRTSTIKTLAVSIESPTAHTVFNVADYAGQHAAVHIQKSQQGGGSPMIRGFSANRILLTVDGIRMNNAIFRGGNLQNIINVDPFHLESMDIHLGPHAITYGSDALGGVIDMRTKRPAEEEGWHGEIGTQYLSINQQWSPHGLLSYRSKKWSYIGDFSFNRYGNLRMGSHGPDRYLNTGIVVDDQLVPPTDSALQNPTRYTQWNTRHILSYDLSPHQQIEYGFYYSRTGDIPRYDRIIQRDAEHNPLFSEWFYGPQTWQMHRARYSVLGKKLKHAVQIAYQRFGEERNERRLQSDILRTRSEVVDAYSFNYDVSGVIGSSLSWSAGVENILNSVGSRATSFNRSDQVTNNILTRYPDDSRWFSHGVYLQGGYAFNDQLALQAGIRYNVSGIRAEIDTSFIPLPFSEIRSATNGISFSTGLYYSLDNNWRTSLTVSQGFRAPNVDDATKVFDSEPGSVIVPNTNLSSEQAYTLEWNIQRQSSSGITGTFTTFYTWIDNIIDRAPTSFSGRDSIFYNGTLSRVLHLENLNNGYIYGIESSISIPIHSKWNWSHQISYQQGRERTNEFHFPVRHVAPLRYITDLRYTLNNWTIGAQWNYNGAITFDDLALSERNKPHLYDLDEHGNPFAPSWDVFNLQAHYSAQRWRVQLQLYNILDRRYRAYSSGIAGAGRGAGIQFSVLL